MGCRILQPILIMHRGAGCVLSFIISTIIFVFLCRNPSHAFLFPRFRMCMNNIENGFDIIPGIVNTDVQFINKTMSYIFDVSDMHFVRHDK